MNIQVILSIVKASETTGQELQIPLNHSLSDHYSLEFRAFRNHNFDKIIQVQVKAGGVCVNVIRLKYRCYVVYVIII